jgi:hypothetical protein
LNVIENRNSANSFILYGNGGESTSKKLEDQKILSPHLLQVSLVYSRSGNESRGRPYASVDRSAT